MNDRIRRKTEEGMHDVSRTLKWALVATVCGFACGISGGFFVKALGYVTELRITHPAFMLLLPAGGVLIFWFYHLLHDDQALGTNLVITSIQSGKEVPARTGVAVFFAALFSHLCGASVGREGAALQIGGSIGHAFSRIFRLNPKNAGIMVMSGMAGTFSAVFGTPVTAVFFAMEVTSIGLMRYTALVPCVIASFVGRWTARRFFGAPTAYYRLDNVPAVSFHTLLRIAGISVLCGLVSILFCVVLRQTARLGRKFFPNCYVRALVFGSALFLLTCLTGGKTYNGTGAVMIAQVIENSSADVHWYTFLMKILFTVLSLAAGYKGGEIVPTFFIGATFGYFIGNTFGFDPSLCAAVSLGAIFCGVTNAPVASLLLCIELFGVEGLLYYVLAIAVAYVASSYYGLYPAQKFVLSKYGSDHIDKGAD